MFNGGQNHGVELGHMTLIQDGPKCSCGNFGCMETVCSATWLARQGREICEKDPSSLISRKTKGDPLRVNAKTVLDCAKQGDEAALRVFERYVEYLSTAIASVISLLDPQVVALGGGISLAGEFLFEPLRQKVQEKAFFSHTYKIIPAVMGNDAGMIGAAMSFEHLF